MFKLKGDKAEVPDMYLGASIQKVETADGTKSSNNPQKTKLLLPRLVPMVNKHNLKITISMP